MDGSEYENTCESKYIHPGSVGEYRRIVEFIVSNAKFTRAQRWRLGADTARIMFRVFVVANLSNY